ncbi:class A sortase [uncultured Limosilactobacillus sp.]|uniref:class A sortase n=1 Tax=uncultured Limosilactobacillus sp. TaxID=2837629 RepID=UPI0025D61766|nr:class A sortase [uncultured Limosilactobacillus sp.]
MINFKRPRGQFKKLTAEEIKQKRYWIIGGIVLLIISLVITFSGPIERHMINSYKPKVSATSIKNYDHKKGTYNYESIKELTLSNIANARARSKNLPVVGAIAIPKIGMSLPIAKGITNQNLALSAATFRDDMKMGKGNYALAGHNMANDGPKLLFSPLYYKAKRGQKIYLTNLKRVYVYQITAKGFVDKHRVDLVANTKKKQITLVTCDTTGNKRLIVRGKYLKSMKYKTAPRKIRKALSQKFNN